MKQESETKRNICMRCNLYHATCYGEQFQWTINRSGQQKKDCANRVCEPDNTVNPMQVEAFMSLYRRKIKGGTECLTAFMEAIVQTSDVVFDEAIAKRPDLINEYYRLKNKGVALEV